MTDAVQAAADLEYADSIATEGSEFNTDLGLETVRAIHSAAYLDGAISESRFERLDLDVVDDDQIASLLEADFDIERLIADSDCETLEDLEDIESAVSQCDLSDEALAASLDVTAALERVDGATVNLAEEGLAQEATVCLLSVCILHMYVSGVSGHALGESLTLFDDE